MLIKAKVTLSNPKDPSLAPVEVQALADSGALHLCIPERLATQLQLEELYRRKVTTAEGKGKETVCPYVGPVEVKFENRGCYTGAIVIGDEVLLGAVPMEDMDILLSPARRSVIVNPQSPDIATSVVK